MRTVPLCTSLHLSRASCRRCMVCKYSRFHTVQHNCKIVQIRTVWKRVSISPTSQAKASCVRRYSDSTRLAASVARRCAWNRKVALRRASVDSESSPCAHEHQHGCQAAGYFTSAYKPPAAVHVLRDSLMLESLPTSTTTSFRHSSCTFSTTSSGSRPNGSRTASHHHSDEDLQYQDCNTNESSLQQHGRREVCTTGHT